jgi:hypothetical protein
MNDQIAGVVRHVLTSFGGALVAGGYLTSEEWTAVAGALAVLIGIVWSILVKSVTGATTRTGAEKSAPPPAS